MRLVKDLPQWLQDIVFIRATDYIEQIRAGKVTNDEEEKKKMITEVFENLKDRDTCDTANLFPFADSPEGWDFWLRVRSDDYELLTEEGYHQKFALKKSSGDPLLDIFMES